MCSKCGFSKEPAAFYDAKRGNWCRSCYTANRKANKARARARLRAEAQECTQCGVSQPLTEYYLRPGGNPKRICKSCSRATSHSYYHQRIKTPGPKHSYQYPPLDFPTLDPWASAEEQYLHEAFPFSADLTEALLLLPPKQRQVLYWHFYECYSLVELAHFWNVHEITAQRWSREGLQALRECLPPSRTQWERRSA